MNHTEADIAAANAYADLPNETFTMQLETLGHLCNLELGFLAGIAYEREALQAKLERYEVALWEILKCHPKKGMVSIMPQKALEFINKKARAALVEASGAEGGK